MSIVRNVRVGDMRPCAEMMFDKWTYPADLWRDLPKVWQDCLAAQKMRMTVAVENAGRDGGDVVAFGCGAFWH